MILKEIAVEEIDLKNETFRISDDLESAPLREALQSIGQLNPVVLAESGSGYLIVCGFRRVHALNSLGKDRALAWIVSGQDSTPIRCFELALWENLGHRQFSPLEKARIISKLVNVFGIAHDAVIKGYLPALGLATHRGTVQSCLAIYGAHPELHKCFLEGRLTQSSVEILAGKPPQIQEHFAQLMERVRFSASLQKKILNLLEELAAISGESFDEPFYTPEAKAVLDDPRLSAFEKGERLNELLHQMRFPRLSKAIGKFSADKKLLALPGSIRIFSDPFFETGDLRVAFDASSPEQFRELAEALYSASRNPLLEELFNVE